MFSNNLRFSLAAASADKKPNRSVSQIVSTLAKRWGLRGGGTPMFAQMGSRVPMGKTDKDILADILDIVNGSSD